MPLKVSDRILITRQRCTSLSVIEGIKNALGTIHSSAIDFLEHLERACIRGSVDFAVAAMHCANETSIFRSAAFLERRNPAGIGITGEPGKLGPTFPSYEGAAYFYVAELLLKTTGSPGPFAFARDYAQDKYDVVLRLIRGSDGPFPEVIRISDLNRRFGLANRQCVWMCAKDGPEAIVSKGHLIIPRIPNQEDTMPVVDIDLSNRLGAALTIPDAIITVHNSGNLSSNRFGERDFVHGGGGSEGVYYHFAVDAGGIMQIGHLWKRGVHAGNVAGNQTSIAIEMCEGSEPWSTTKENTANLLAMLATRHPSLNWSGAEGFRFSLDRVVEHRDWAGANPNCPRRLITTDNGVEKIVGRSFQIASGMSPTPVGRVKPHPIGGEADRTGKTHEDDQGNEWVWVKKAFFMEKPVQAYEYANVAARKGPLYKPGKRITIYYLVAAEGPDGRPDMWGTTKLGWRVRIADLI